MNLTFQKLWRNILLPLVPMIFWGSLFPMIKVGYRAFAIDSTSVPDILMFAALRFLVCGALVCGIAFCKKESIGERKGSAFWGIILVGFFGIVLHYACTYVGLALTEGSKTALLKQLGSLFYICFAFLFIRSEKFSVFKIIGAVLGFGGIVAINANGGGFSLSWADGLILLASVCTVISGIVSAVSVQKSSIFWVTGISQFSGGIILLICALAMGGNFPTFSLPAFFAFAYICTASILGYTLWYYVQRTAELSHLYIIKFSEPLFACVFSAILLGEEILKWQYLLAFLLISAGILAANHTKKEKISQTSSEKNEKEEHQ